MFAALRRLAVAILLCVGVTVVGSLVITRAMRALLFEVAPNDPVVIVSVKECVHDVGPLYRGMLDVIVSTPAIAGKTGTAELANASSHAWFMGYVPQICTGVWVGYSKGEIPMRSLRVLGGGEAFGGSIAAPIWHDYMIQAVANLAAQNFPTPPPQKSGTVPNVVGMKEADAHDTLRKANYVPFSRTVDSSEPAGTVVAQSPAGGSSAVLGSQVTISVSNGKGPKPSPKPKKRCPYSCGEYTRRTK